MVHTFIGDLGHLFVIIAFVSALIATFAYYKATTTNDLSKKGWIQYARTIFYIHSAAILGVIFSLFFIIYNHYFEYHYAWSHSSRDLPVHYMISCFWEGQEGSFLLWTFWNVVLGIILIHTNKFWEAPIMVIFALVQAFLVSMILGVVIFDLKIGSSPFILLRDAMDAPIFNINPDFVPEDGTGLNPLLQNYWMVIHPPTLFLGFAATLIPFAYCIAGLWQKKYREWVRPALPWTHFASLILGVGILMGAYWAYETLNFGGYWSWDPVENAVYVPWIVLVACMHTMITFKKSDTALKTSIVLVIGMFILILYSTFLTRSGILGNSSVHSFTDLGLSGQLLIYLLTFTILSVVLAIVRWKDIPSSEREASVYSREFWIFIGAATLCLMGFQVLVPTSIPVYNAIIELFGGISNVAPPADPILFYSKFQLWFAVLVALLSGTGQFFWWKKMDKKKLFNELTYPVVITLILTSILLVVSGIKEIDYIILMTASIYSIVANGKILMGIFRSNYKLSGGSIAHMGIAMILIGIMFSSGYSKVISLNNSGLLLFNDASDEFNQENVLLWLNEPRQMQEYELIYKGQYVEPVSGGDYIEKSLLKPTPEARLAIASNDIIIEDEKKYSKGDTITIYPENTYFKVDYHKDGAHQFTLFPRGQVNPSMGLIASPDIKSFFDRDLYTHISSMPDPKEETEWSETKLDTVKVGQRFFINDYVSVLEEITRVTSVDDIVLGEKDIAVKARIKIYGKGENYIAEPIYIIRMDDKTAGIIPEYIYELGLRVSLNKIYPESETFELGSSFTQKDYVILKAMEKPLINILWIGTLMLVLGFGIAIFRRYSEFVKMRDKDLE